MIIHRFIRHNLHFLCTFTGLTYAVVYQNAHIWGMSQTSYDKSCCQSSDCGQTLKSRHCWLSGYLVARTGCCRHEWPFALRWVDTADVDCFCSTCSTLGVAKLDIKYILLNNAMASPLKDLFALKASKLLQAMMLDACRKSSFGPNFPFSLLPRSWSWNDLDQCVSQVSCLVNLISISWEGLAHCCWLPLMRNIVVDLTNHMNNFINSWASKIFQ